MLLINDTDALARQARWAEIESSDEQITNWLKRESLFSECVDDPDTSPLLTVRKIGTPMSHVEMERRLCKLNPSLKFTWTGIFAGVNRSEAKWCNQVMPDGTLRQLYSFDSGMLPERSVWRSVTKWVLDPNYKQGPFDEDLKDWEVVPRSDADIKQLLNDLQIPYTDDPSQSNPPWSEVKDTPHWWIFYEFERRDEHAARPGWIRIVEPVGELTRGWRTCVLKCVALGLITTRQAEDEFLADNTPEWKQHTGKGRMTRPW